MQYPIRLEESTGRSLAVVRRRAAPHELPQVIPAACGLVWDALRSQQLTGAGRHVALYLDDQINVEIGIELESDLANRLDINLDEVVRSTTPAGWIAMTTHYGPYGQLHAAHHAVRHYCLQNGYSLSGPHWEIYGHWQDAWNHNPSLISTEVYHLLMAPPKRSTT